MYLSPRKYKMALNQEVQDLQKRSRPFLDKLRGRHPSRDAETRGHGVQSSGHKLGREGKENSLSRKREQSTAPHAGDRSGEKRKPITGLTDGRSLDSLSSTVAVKA